MKALSHAPSVGSPTGWTGFFGRLGEESLLDIWEGEVYVAFREAFQERLKALQELIFLRRSSPEDVGTVLASRPLPEPCTTCYKAYGL